MKKKHVSSPMNLAGGLYGYKTVVPIITRTVNRKELDMLLEYKLDKNGEWVLAFHNVGNDQYNVILLQKYNDTCPCCKRKFNGVKKHEPS
jgi:hypothetical protein